MNCEKWWRVIVNFVTTQQQINQIIGRNRISFTVRPILMPKEVHLVTVF